MVPTVLLVRRSLYKPPSHINTLAILQVLTLKHTLISLENRPTLENEPTPKNEPTLKNEPPPKKEPTLKNEPTASFFAKWCFPLGWLQQDMAQ